MTNIIHLPAFARFAQLVRRADGTSARLLQLRRSLKPARLEGEKGAFA